MKKKKVIKIITIVCISLFLIAVVTILVIYSQRNAIIKKAIETIGPKATKGEVKVEKVNVSVFSADASVDGIFVGNAKGFDSDFAMKLNHISVDIDRSTLTDDVIIINKITIDGAEVSWEGFKGKNLFKIQDNIMEFAGLDKPEEGGDSGEDSDPEPEPEADPEPETKEPESSSESPAPSEEADPVEEKKVIIKELNFVNGKIHIWGAGKNLLTLPIPSIQLTDIGQESNGATIRKVIAQVFPQLLNSFGKIIEKSYDEVVKAFSALGEKGKEWLKDAGDSLKDAGDSIKDGTKKLIDGLGF